MYTSKLYCHLSSFSDEKWCHIYCTMKKVVAVFLLRSANVSMELIKVIPDGRNWRNWMYGYVPDKPLMIGVPVRHQQYFALRMVTARDIPKECKLAPRNRKHIRETWRKTHEFSCSELPAPHQERCDRTKILFSVTPLDSPQRILILSIESNKQQGEALEFGRRSLKYDMTVYLDVSSRMHENCEEGHKLVVGWDQKHPRIVKKGREDREMNRDRGR